MQESDNTWITMDQLAIGLYVYLDLRWFEHPFAFNNFKIKDAEQIAIIRSLGLTKVRYDPARGDRKPPPAENIQKTEAAETVAEAPAAQPLLSEHPALAAKRALIEKIKRQHVTSARIETVFVETAKAVHNIERNLLAKPEETVAQAQQLVASIADSMLTATDLAIHVMSDRLGSEELYFHSLNVTMLSLMVARDFQLPVEVVRSLGMGALFHDLGRRQMPARILMKLEPLTVAERSFYELHCEYGVAIAQELKLSPLAQTIIHEHHECFDGSGYPRRLKGEAINLAARIVAIANYYDELCNPYNVADALTPHEALAMMFAKWRNRFDPKLLQVFVRCLGVYPPGTIVQLSNGVIGMVASINTARPMKPMLVVYDATTPKDEAILVDMDGEIDVNIAKAIRPVQLPREIYDYLSPRSHLSYYFDAGPPGNDAVRA